MSNYNTGNPVPSIDPRDLDDNATNFDDLLNSVMSTVIDRTGVPRKTWYQMELDAAALVSPNVSALAALVGAADKLGYFTGSGAMAITSFTAQARQLLDDTSFAAMLVTLGAASVASPALTGTPTAPTAAPGTNTTQLATTAFVEAARVILAAADALKAPLASPALTGVPTAPTAAIGTNTTQLATMAAMQARILGTVSQSAGVPTGTILETGGTQTGTGTYIKMADGTLIMHKTLAIATGSTTAKGSIFGSAATSAGALPVNLAGNFTMQFSGTDNAGGGWAAQDVVASNSTWGSYSTRNHVSAGTAGTITLLAIGRWF